MTGKRWGNGELQAVLDVAKRYRVLIGMVAAATFWFSQVTWKAAEDHKEAIETRTVVRAGFARADSLDKRRAVVIRYLFDQQNARLDSFQRTLNKFDKHGVPVREGRAPFYKQYGPPPQEVSDWFWQD